MYVPDWSGQALEQWQEKREQLEASLGYEFHEPARLQEAMTHRSFAHEAREQGIRPYERLEFLGDAVLELVVSHLLWGRYPDLPEGDLTRLRAEVVKKQTLADVAQRLELGDMLLLGKGEKQRGGMERPSILADAMEALLGAIFVDGGLEAARQVCHHLFQPELQRLDIDNLPNFKNKLQELAAALQQHPPRYRLVEVEGPEHQPTFVMEVAIGEEHKAIGRGNSKKTATQEAARLLLDHLQQEEPQTT